MGTGEGKGEGWGGAGWGNLLMTVLDSRPNDGHMRGTKRDKGRAPSPDALVFLWVQVLDYVEESRGHPHLVS